RHVDAINEPNRPIPSGRIPGRWGLYIATAWTALSLALAATLGVWGFAAAVFGLVLAWLYSAPPVRLKQNGWWGNAACGLCYEGLPWFTGAAVMTASAPDARIVIMALLYSIGAHGIMTLNDFKSVEGDRRMGINSLPVLLGPDHAARFACWVMALPQVVVVDLLLHWNRPVYAIAVTVLLAAQILLMAHLLKSPRERAPWYNGTGIGCYVLGMLVSAFALASLQGT
ncbi:MAG: chlorophyll synthase ChlG, partial [Tardiphaga sp.]